MTESDPSAPNAVVFDLDGTVVHGGSLIDGAEQSLAAVREAGLDVLFLTNNPTRSASDWAEHLTEQGIEASADEVLTSAVATVEYLDAHHAEAPTLPIAGETVVEQLRDSEVAFVEEPDTAEVVVAGFDLEFDYGDLTRGLRALLDGATLVGTDPDRWVPTTEGPIPGSGAVTGALAEAAEVEPEAVLGKPSAETIDLALDRLVAPPEACLLVGDRLDTDVAMGERAGMATALVLTGASDREALANSEIQPDHVLDSIAEVPGLL